MEAPFSRGRDDAFDVDPRQLERAARRAFAVCGQFQANNWSTDLASVSPKLKQADRPPSEVLASTEVERSLRDRALDPHPRATLDLEACNADRRDAISILADFYEEHGQPSRAALWREQLLEAGQRPIGRQHHELEELPDLLTRTLPTFQALDFRRSQMIWLLRKQGVSARKIGAAFRILAFNPNFSATRVEQLVRHEDQRIRIHATYEQLWPTLKATQRLIAAGALSGDRPTPTGRPAAWFDFCELPPEDWPAEHKRRRDKRGAT